MSYILKAHFNFFSGSPLARWMIIEGHPDRCSSQKILPVILIAIRNSLEKKKKESSVYCHCSYRSFNILMREQRNVRLIPDISWIINWKWQQLLMSERIDGFFLALALTLSVHEITSNGNNHWFIAVSPNGRELVRLILTKWRRRRVLLEINFAGIISVKSTKYMCTKCFGLSIGKELPVDLNEFFLC